MAPLPPIFAAYGLAVTTIVLLHPVLVYLYGFTQTGLTPCEYQMGIYIKLTHTRLKTTVYCYEVGLCGIAVHA